MRSALAGGLQTLAKSLDFIPSTGGATEGFQQESEVTGLDLQIPLAAV